MRINDNQQHATLKRSSIVDVNPMPSTTRPLPWVQWRYRWLSDVSDVYLTCVAVFHVTFNLRVQPRPQQIATCESFHIDNVGVCACRVTHEAERHAPGEVFSRWRSRTTHLAVRSIRICGDSCNRTLVVSGQTIPALQNVALVRAQDRQMPIFRSGLS